MIRIRKRKLKRMQVMAAPLIVLDLDGTLVDTASDLVATLNFVFARVGIPPSSMPTRATWWEGVRE